MASKTDLRTVLREIRQHAGPLVAPSPLDPALLRKSVRAIRAAYSARKKPTWLTVNCGGKGGKPGPCKTYQGSRTEWNGDYDNSRLATFFPANLGHFFTDSPDSAKHFMRKGGSLREVELTGKMFKIDAEGKNLRDVADKIARVKRRGTFAGVSVSNVIDGVHHERLHIVFDPGSIVTKSTTPYTVNTSNVGRVLNCGGPGSGKPGPCPLYRASDREDDDADEARGGHQALGAGVYLAEDRESVKGYGKHVKEYSIPNESLLTVAGDKGLQPHRDAAREWAKAKTDAHLKDVKDGKVKIDGQLLADMTHPASQLRGYLESKGYKGIRYIQTDKTNDHHNQVLVFRRGHLTRNAAGRGQFSSQKSPWRVTIRKLAPYLLDLMPDLTRTQAEGIARSIQLGLRSDAKDQDVADMIEQYGVEPERAVLIARTEMARAKADTELGRLKTNERVVYVLADGACPKCVKVKRNLKERRLTAKQAEGIIPVHPNCYCRWKTVNVRSGREVTRNEGVDGQLLEYSRLVENVFCPTGEGGGVDPTCKETEGETVKPYLSNEHRKDLFTAARQEWPQALQAAGVSDEQVLSIHLYGSFITGKNLPNDIDAVVRVESGALNPKTPMGKSLGGVVDAGAWNLTHKLNILFVDSKEGETNLLEKYAQTPRYKTKISKLTGWEYESDEIENPASGFIKVSKSLFNPMTRNEGEADVAILEYSRLVENVFCATGEGGGVDPSCSSGKKIGEGRRAYPMADKSEWYSDADYEKTGGKMVEMSPDEYLSKVRSLDIDDASRDNINDLKNTMKVRGIDPVKIYKGGKEDGRHRAHAAKELGIKKIPVIVWD